MPSLSSFLPTVKPGKSFSTMKAVMPLYPADGIDRRKHDEDAGLFAVGDPHLLSVQDVLVALQFGAACEAQMRRSLSRLR